MANYYQPQTQAAPVDFSPVNNFLALRQQLNGGPGTTVAQSYGQLVPPPAPAPTPAPTPTAQAGGTGYQQLAQAAYAAGFRGQALLNAVAIGQAESGGNPNAHNTNAGTGDNSYGDWQINLLGPLASRVQTYHLGTADALFDPNTNARVAYQMSGGGANFNPWSTYKSGAYKNYLGAAQGYLSANGYLSGAPKVGSGGALS